MTWIAINRMDHAGVAVYPLGPGHFLWIAGILLIVFAESSAFRFSPVRWLTLGLGIVTVAMSVPILIGFTMRAPSEADDFHYDQAWDTQKPAECRLIDANAVGRPDQRDSPDFTYMQSDCYRNVAAMLREGQGDAAADAGAAAGDERDLPVEQCWRKQRRHHTCDRRHR